MRLDLGCVEAGLFSSRNAAKEAILRGFVLLNDEICLKPSFEIKENDKISLSDKAQQLPRFVGRAGEKLWHFLGFLDSMDSKDLIESRKPKQKSIESKNNNSLDSMDFLDSIESSNADSIDLINNKQELKNLQCAIKSAFVLDVGSSTGGFAQCWLLRGAKLVVCVDVGKDQLHKSLKQNPNLLFFEETDIRAFAENLEFFSSIIAKRFNEIFAQNTARFNIISCDVSFISLSNIIQSLAKIVEFSRSYEDDIYLLLLFKPQFEVGIAAKRDKRGVLKDKNALKFALKNILEILQKYNFLTLCVKKSEILGKEGNEEFFIACKAAK